MSLIDDWAMESPQEPAALLSSRDALLAGCVTNINPYRTLLMYDYSRPLVTVRPTRRSMLKYSSKSTPCCKLHHTRLCRTHGRQREARADHRWRRLMSQCYQEPTCISCVSSYGESGIVLDRRNLHQPRRRSRARVTDEANEADLPTGQRSCRVAVRTTFYTVQRHITSPYCFNSIIRG